MAAALLSHGRMKFSIEIGHNEKHLIEFSFNQLLGRSTMRVDGQEVFRKGRWFSEPRAEHYDFEIGQFEPVRVRIEKERKHLFGSKYRVFIDDRLTRLYHGV